MSRNLSDKEMLVILQARAKRLQRELDDTRAAIEKIIDKAGG